MPKLFRLLIALPIIIYIFFFSPFTKIKSLEIIGGAGCIPSQVSSQELNLARQNLLTFSKSDLERMILSKYRCVKKVSIKRIFPAKVRIGVELQSEIVKIADTNLFLTQDQQVTDKTFVSKLPILYPDRNLNLKVGEKVQDEDIKYVLKLTIELSKSDFTAVSIRIIDQESIAVYNSADLIAIFSTNKPISEQVDSLQLVLSKAKIDAAKIAKIDLRFDKPVIVNK